MTRLWDVGRPDLDLISDLNFITSDLDLDLDL